MQFSMTTELGGKIKTWLRIHDNWLQENDVANPNDFLFLNAKGTLNHSSGITHYYQQFQKRLGFSYQFSTHTLRHFLASQLIRNPKVSLTFVSRWLGHSSETITQRYYLGLIPDEMIEQQEQVAKAIQNI